MFIVYLDAHMHKLCIDIYVKEYKIQVTNSHKFTDKNRKQCESRYTYQSLV
jgi:hypothetical protein